MNMSENMSEKPGQIEQGIDRNRAELASILDDLQHKLSVENLTSGALGMLRSNSTALTVSLDKAVRTNPYAVALVGAGVAWLMFGGKRNPAQKRAKLEALSTWEDDGGPARPSSEPAAAMTKVTVAQGQTGQLIEDHPMLAGAVTMAMGIALGAALPRKKG